MADETLNPHMHFYQSANTNADVIKNDFIVRLREYDIIMDDIRRNPMNGSVQHYLVLGRRGSGKSTLLRRIQVEINSDEVLKQKFIAINPAEEQANIYKLYDLWETIKEELEHEGIEVEEPEWSDDSNIYSRSLFASIHAAIERSGKKIVLLLDNIDRIFENLKEDAGLLRETLLNYNDIKIIGGSTRMTEHFWRYDLPFYEFFRVLKLEPLTGEEIKKLILHWGEKYKLEILKEFAVKRAGQLETVRILTDGLPRTLLLFVNILLNRENSTGFEYIKMIMDRVTPLYQERLNNLPPAQRKIVLQLAFIWEAAGARNVAEASHMDIKIASAQLNQLANSGIVDKINTGNKNNLYRIAERFFNLWLIFTQGSQKEKRRAKYLTIFLESFYGADELKVLAQDHLKCLKEMEPGKAALLTKAYAQSKYIPYKLRDELINKTLELNIGDDLQKQLPQTVFKISSDLEDMIRKELWNKAIKKANEIEQEDGFKDYLLGWIYQKWGNNNKAEEYYIKAAEKGDGGSIYNLAIIYHNQQNLALAEKYYLKAIDLNFCDAFFNIAVLYKTQRKFSLAERYYLIAIDKGDNLAPYNLAVLYQTQNKFDLAEKYYIDAVEKNQIEAMSNLALLYYQLNIKKNKAIELISLARKINQYDARLMIVENIITIWNGGNIDMTNIKKLIINKDYELLNGLIINLLIHYQTNLVYNLFSDPEFGKELKERYQPLYYAVALLAGKEANIALKIPPELQGTVDEILKEVKEKQKFYYPAEV